MSTIPLSCHTHHQPASTNSSEEFLILYYFAIFHNFQRRRSARVEEINFEVSFISQMCTSVHVRNALFYMCMELNSRVYMCKHGEWWQAKIKIQKIMKTSNIAQQRRRARSGESQNEAANPSLLLSLPSIEFIGLACFWGEEKSASECGAGIFSVRSRRRTGRTAISCPLKKGFSLRYTIGKYPVSLHSNHRSWARAARVQWRVIE